MTQRSTGLIVCLPDRSVVTITCLIYALQHFRWIADRGIVITGSLISYFYRFLVHDPLQFRCGGSDQDGSTDHQKQEEMRRRQHDEDDESGGAHLPHARHKCLDEHERKV